MFILKGMLFDRSSGMIDIYRAQ